MFDVEPEEGETLTELENRCAKKFQDLSEDQKLAFVVKKEDWKKKRLDSSQYNRRYYKARLVADGSRQTGFADSDVHVHRTW